MELAVVMALAVGVFLLIIKIKAVHKICPKCNAKEFATVTKCSKCGYLFPTGADAPNDDGNSDSGDDDGE